MRSKPVSRSTRSERFRDALDDFATGSPARFAILVFTALIGILTAVLMLPSARAGDDTTNFVDALFTAVSTICVTGLSVVDMGTHWSLFGHIAILIGLQVGGIGVLTVASMMGLIVSRRLGLRTRLMAASDSNPSRIHHGPVSESQAVRLGEMGGLLATVAISAIAIELVVAISIYPRLLAAGFDGWTSVWQSFYYAASAFTNTGFTPNPDGLEPFTGDPWMLSMLALAVFLGSLGFPVIFALARGWRNPKRWSVHVKLTLTTTIGLIILGALALTLLEWNNLATLGAQDPVQRPLTGTFISIMSRSGGFSTIDIGEANGSTLLVLDMLMFVGGGSASTAGGIKVTTLAVLFLAAFAEARGDEDMQAFERRIPVDVLRLAVSVTLWGATIVAAATIFILHLTKAPLDFVLFDVISAFATSGLTTGLTETLPDPGKYALAATMWAGRVGTVTLAAALAASQRRQLFRRAEERPIVG
ncbi:TrkH family potassium uptake protein [Salinibacterium sp. dk2585]|uniref:TrkH family potassium uptake protein n=1 Tax=unclassified Salinibacterium TaxID=2632331 RepID=UPI0011C2464A|nr:MULTISPECIES: potassium transporter TrkG [unclassified Salinibacterium]QEE62369.1 TrkH family potassium uptake protein [Salinibacterium sp. dk2585]TXK52748.1 TrkH family potassium uptake protein [Salinibacterium sp. dk5596]